MPADLYAENIKAIHVELEKQFPLMLKGIQKEGLIQAAIDRQNRSLYNSPNPYESIFDKAAALMEAITRWHPFNDGNKRTGLLSAFLYLYINNYYLAIPLDAVRFTQKIAATQGQDEETINSLIKEISDWLREYTGKNENDFATKVLKYNLWPALKLLFLNTIGFKKYVRRRLEYWFAADAHPEYKQELEQVFSYLRKLMWSSAIEIINAKKNKKWDVKYEKFDDMRCAIAEHDVLTKEEDRLYNSQPNEKGIKQIKSKCFRCNTEVILETDPTIIDEYFIRELNEKI